MSKLIKFCFPCYNSEHEISQCPMPHDYVVCSLCSSRDHRHNNCISNFKKCINCSGDHTTISSRALLTKLFETNGKQTSDRKIILPLMLQQQENPRQISITISQPCSKEVVLIKSCSV